MAIENATLEDVRITFRNFAGRADQYNAAGKRNFTVLLPDDVAEAMAADGWTIKYLNPREEGDAPQATIKVNVHFGGKGRPPRIVLITSRGRNTLDEEQVEMLDWADIKNVDLSLRAYEYEVRGQTGVSAYLVAAYITIEEDALEKKYGVLDAPDNEDDGL